jgi:hypothetical protein
MFPAFFTELVQGATWIWLAKLAVQHHVGIMLVLEAALAFRVAAVFKQINADNKITFGEGIEMVFWALALLGMPLAIVLEHYHFFVI